MGLSEKGWATYLAEAEDLEAVRAALVKETVVREVMAKSGEPRDIVVDMIEAMKSMADEAVLDLMEGEPTTLRAAVQRYADELETQDEVLPRDRIVEELAMILGYPWSTSVELEIERPDDETLTVKVGGELIAGANHDEHGWAGMDLLETTARNVHKAVMDRVGRG
jgi:hypothetical protein